MVHLSALAVPKSRTARSRGRPAALRCDRSLRGASLGISRRLSFSDIGVDALLDSLKQLHKAGSYHYSLDPNSSSVLLFYSHSNFPLLFFIPSQTINLSTQTRYLEPAGSQPPKWATSRVRISTVGRVVSPCASVRHNRRSNDTRKYRVRWSTVFLQTERGYLHAMRVCNLERGDLHAMRVCNLEDARG